MPFMNMDVDTAHLDAIHAAQGMGSAEKSETIVLTGDKIGHLVACIAAHRRIRFKDDCESFRK